MKIIERRFTEDGVSQRNENGRRKRLSSNVRQLILGPNVPELDDSPQCMLPLALPFFSPSFFHTISLSPAFISA